MSILEKAKRIHRDQTSVSCRLRNKDYEALTVFCNDNDMSRAEFMRLAILHNLKKEKKGKK